MKQIEYEMWAVKVIERMEAEDVEKGISILVCELIQQSWWTEKVKRKVNTRNSVMRILRQCGIVMMREEF
tara:strand:+ start:299 stop:508 length:210 start_codon:yes stop_codon:yes gene_type:complete